MNIDGILGVCEEIELNEGVGFIKDLVNKLGHMSWSTAKSFLKKKAIDFAAMVKDDPYIDERHCLAIINQRFGTHFSDLHSIAAKGLMEKVDKIDEGLKDWWNEAAKNMYGALSFYPLLTAFLEFDKIIKNSGDANVRSMIIYFLIWVLIISGKVVAGTIGEPGTEQEEGDKANPKSWTEIANRARERV